MDLFTFLYMQMDKILMPFYRLPDHSVAGYFSGTFILCLACVIIGEYSISAAFRINRKKIAGDNEEMARFHDLSIKALKAGNKAAYKACNSRANDAFGKSFFTRISLSAASLWPLFIALGWMQYRFSGVRFSLLLLPGKWITVGYMFTFVLCYITARVLFAKFRKTILLSRRPS